MLNALNTEREAKISSFGIPDVGRFNVDEKTFRDGYPLKS